MTLLRRTDRGLYCEAGDFHVDPWAAVDRAVVTHAHGDHVAWGCRAYLTSLPGAPVLRQRLDPSARIRGVPYGRALDVNGVRFSLHPAGPGARCAPALEAPGWPEIAAARSRAREFGAGGLMLKRRASPYGSGRCRGDWWKWKVEPHSVDAVLMYAQPGSGRRGGLYTEYTLDIWDGDTLVPFAKAYSGLSDEEIRRVDAFVRRNTVAKFGPVRTVRPELVFEVAFEGIQRSTRHKSGLAVRSPRMARWRTDKRPEDADTVETVRALMAEEEGARGG